MVERIREKSLEKRRARNKAKADAAFDRTYDDSKSSSPKSAPESGAPRAALYEGKMGSSHKKASKLQRPSAASSASSASKKGSSLLASSGKHSSASSSVGKLQGALGAVGNIASAASSPISKLSTLRSNPSAFRSLVVAALAVFILLMVYGPAQQYYCQMRETDRIEAEYAAVAARNDTLSESIHTLSSSEGIADKAHEDLGYIKPGEHTAVVMGLDLSDDKRFQGNVAPGSVPAPDTWYSPVLDVLFGYGL